MRESSTVGPVPESFRPLYDELSEQIASWEPRATGAESPGGTTFGAELLAANGNRGAALLAPSTMDGVRLVLDRLEGLGVGGVTVQISDPLLWPGFPRSDEYASFFVDVAGEVRSRGLILLVETGPAFTGTPFSTIDYDWPSLTLDAYFAGRRAQLERIARDVRPDYLSIGSEPATEAMLTGLAYDLETYLAFVRDTAMAIERSSGVRVGAGSGTWEDPAYARRLADEPSLDFLGLHIYPLTNGVVDYLDRAEDAAALADAAGKDLILGEAWLYKATPEEVRRGLDYASIYARDAYGFWQPLDVRFVEMMVGLSRRWGVEYASFFWSGFFFGYLEYDDELTRLPMPELLRRLNQVQADRLTRGGLSLTGEAYRRLLAGE